MIGSTRRSRPLCSVAIALGLFWLAPAVAEAQLGPGFLVDPPGLEMFVTATYNPAQDEYLITYSGDDALALRLSPCGEILDEVVILEGTPSNAVSQVAATYNPDRDEYLAVVRLNDPQNMFGRFLDTFGEPIGEPFSVGSGGGPRPHYSPVAGQYLLGWGRGNRDSWIRVVSADSGAESPTLGPVQEVDDGVFSMRLAYGSGSDRFLAAFTRIDGDNNDNVRGLFVDGDGTLLEPGFLLAGGPRTQQTPQVAYAPSADRWLVAVQDWINADGAGHSADVNALLVDATGAVQTRFFISDPVAGGWDSLGPMAYHPTTNRFYVTYYLEPSVYLRTVDPTDGALGPIELLIEEGGATAITVRPHPLNPQVLVTWKPRFNGVYASILNLAGECSDRAVLDDAELLSADLPGTLACGEAYSAAIVMRNTGQTSWTRSTGYQLGAVDNSDPFRDDPRVWLPPDTAVAPGSEHAFDVDLVAPDVPGSYLTDWQMVQDSVGFFGPVVSHEIGVQCGGDTGATADAGYDSDADVDVRVDDDGGAPDTAEEDSPGTPDGTDATVDLASDGSRGRLEGGCGCAMAGRSRDGGLSALIGVLAVRRRRR